MLEAHIWAAEARRSRRGHGGQRRSVDMGAHYQYRFALRRAVSEQIEITLKKEEYMCILTARRIERAESPEEELQPQLRVPYPIVSSRKSEWSRDRTTPTSLLEPLRFGRSTE